jgi:hypothetical protein
MKTKLLLLGLIMCINVNAQDTLIFDETPYGLCYDSMIVYGTDTLQAIIVVCDTTEYRPGLNTGSYPIFFDTISSTLLPRLEIYDNSLFWIKGYIVYKWDYWSFYISQYLDEDKQKLPDKYIVWDYKIIE